MTIFLDWNLNLESVWAIKIEWNGQGYTNYECKEGHIGKMKLRKVITKAGCEGQTKYAVLRNTNLSKMQPFFNFILIFEH